MENRIGALDWMACDRCVHSHPAEGGCDVDRDLLEDGIEIDVDNQALLCGCFVERRTQPEAPMGITSDAIKALQKVPADQHRVKTADELAELSSDIWDAIRRGFAREHVYGLATRAAGLALAVMRAHEEEP